VFNRQLQTSFLLAAVESSRDHELLNTVCYAADHETNSRNRTSVFFKLFRAFCASMLSFSVCFVQRSCQGRAKTKRLLFANFLTNDLGSFEREGRGEQGERVDVWRVSKLKLKIKCEIKISRANASRSGQSQKSERPLTKMSTTKNTSFD
jgi:hypothetical protein